MRILTFKKRLLIFPMILSGSLYISAQETSNTGIKDSVTNGYISEIPSFQKEKAKVTIHQDSRIQKLLAIKTEMEKKGQLSENYKIQLYYGTSNQANIILKKAQENFPQWDSEIIWETPNFKVWLGNYRSKLEVDRAMTQVGKIFSGAFSFKP